MPSKYLFRLRKAQTRRTRSTAVGTSTCGRDHIERFWAEGEVDLDRVLESVGARIEPSDAVVEIGCGLGRLTRAIAARARSVTGIDVSEEMLTRARQLNAGVENVAWVHGNGTDL